MLVPLVDTLEGAGPVLVIEGTRANTVRLAKAIGEERPVDQSDEVLGLTTFVQARLGDVHPLVAVLQKGVGYHHGSLPLDVRAAIEDAMRDGVIKVLVATTSMTEGVNLPVRSVVIARQGQGGSSADDLRQFIRGSKLLNATGRAGRAGLETEGVVVLCRQSTFRRADFALLDPTDEDLTAISALAQEIALEELAASEAAIRDEQDSIFVAAPDLAAEFVAFVWFIASELDRVNPDWTPEALDSYLTRTLAWVQLDDQGRELLRSVAAAGVLAFRNTASDRRRRWAKSGLPLTNAVTLDQLAEEVSALAIFDSTLEKRTVLDSILGEQRLERLLLLPGSPTARVRPYRSSPLAQAQPVDVRGLLDEWLGGTEYDSLANTYFPDVNDEEYRSEQLGDLVGGLFENYLPWVLGTLIGWANELHLQDDPFSEPIPAEISAFIRFGVESTEALSLMVNGLQSRRLAHAIAGAYGQASVDISLLDWLRGMNLEQWRTMFEASPRELLELIGVLRIRHAAIAARVLGGQVASVALEAIPSDPMPGTVKVRLAHVPGPAPQLLGAWDLESGGTLFGVVPGPYHEEVEALLQTNLELDTAVSPTEDGVRLEIQLAS
jgi:hypothetical protein